MAVASQLAEPAEPIESTNLTEPAGAAVARRSQRDIDHLRALMQQTPASLTGNAIGIGLMLAMYGGLAAAKNCVLARLAASAARRAVSAVAISTRNWPASSSVRAFSAIACPSALP